MLSDARVTRNDVLSDALTFTAYYSTAELLLLIYSKLISSATVGNSEFEYVEICIQGKAFGRIRD